MAAVRGRVFLWGGRKDEALLFDPATGKSEELPPSPAPTRGFAGSAVLDSKIYMFGGYGDGQSHRKDALEFDLAKKRWRVLPEPPLSVRYNPTVVADRRRIYVWAGLGDGDAFPKDAAFYDPRTDRWERLADIPGSSLTARLYYR
jgi:N-acetylneuraminic acid mutarotase